MAEAGDSEFILPDNYRHIVMCPICNSLYDSKDRCPMDTFCGHNYCEPCLRNIVSSSRIFRCLICGKCNNLDEENAEWFPVSECILDIMEAMCEECKVHRGDKRCFVHCDSKLCEDCLENHQAEMLKTTNSKLTELTDCIKELDDHISMDEHQLNNRANSTGMFIVKVEDSVSQCAEKMKQYLKDAEGLEPAPLDGAEYQYSWNFGCLDAMR